MKLLTKHRIAVGAAVSAFAAALVALTPQSAGATGAAAPLGVPDHIGYSVGNVSANRAQLSAATGTQFSAPKSTAALVYLPGVGTKAVVLKTSVSLRGAPFLELVQASPAIGPWAIDPEQSTPFMSYAVDNVVTAGVPLAKAGYKLEVVAPTFTFWRSPGGIRIRLLDQDKAPVASPQTAQAAIDFGPPPAVTYYCGDYASQLTAGLGVAFREPQTFTMPWELSDGSSQLITSTANISVPGGPFVNVESTNHSSPLEPACDPTRPFSTLNFATPDVAGGDAQMAAAGLQFVGRVAIPGYVSEYRTVGGIYLEVVNPVFVPTS